jgi:hypothetical protein
MFYDPQPTPGESEDFIDGAILNFLLDQERPLWISDLDQEMGFKAAHATTDGVTRLRAVSLVYITEDDFIFITPAAARFAQIAI